MMQGVKKCIRFLVCLVVMMYDGILVFLPLEDNVKLNNLKRLAEKMGEDTSFLSDKEWEEYSTLKSY